MSGRSVIAIHLHAEGIPAMYRLSVKQVTYCRLQYFQQTSIFNVYVVIQEGAYISHFSDGMFYLAATPWSVSGNRCHVSKR